MTTTISATTTHESCVGTDDPPASSHRKLRHEPSLAKREILSGESRSSDGGYVHTARAWTSVLMSLRALVSVR